MQRTQISLTDEARRALDAAALQTSRLLSSLIRDAVEQVYGSDHSTKEDLAGMCRDFGSWNDHGIDGASSVDHLRSGSRLVRDGS